MSYRVFTSAEQLVVEQLDFTNYDDPVVQSIHEWEQAGKQWSSRVRMFFHAATVQGRPEPAAQRLEQATEIYADRFEAAATTIGSDPHIAPERAVQALSKLIRAEDAARRRQLRKHNDMMSVPVPTNAYVKELAQAYGDPSGELMTPDTMQDFELSTLARLSFLAHIEDQANTILGNLRHAPYETKQSPKQSHTQVAARRAFGRYQPPTS